jgi:hypothetical protein
VVGVPVVIFSESGMDLVNVSSVGVLNLIVIIWGAERPNRGMGNAWVRCKRARERRVSVGFMVVILMQLLKNWKERSEL